MSSQTLRVGLIGYQFMGKAHSNAYRQVNRFFTSPYQIEMATICGRPRVGEFLMTTSSSFRHCRLARPWGRAAPQHSARSA